MAQGSVILRGITPLVLGASGTAVPLTGSVSETVLKSVAIPVLGANDSLRIFSLWNWTNNGNTKTYRVRLGGLSGVAHTAVPVTTTVSGQVVTIIYNNNATNAQKSFPANSFGMSSASATSLLTGTLQTNAGTTVDFTGQLGVDTDTISLQGYTVELIRGV